MIYGTTKLGTATDVSTGQLRIQRVSVTTIQHVAKLEARIDGLGSGSGIALYKPVIYNDDTGALVASGPEVAIVDGAPVAWKDFRFDGLVELAVAEYMIGVQTGGPTNASRGYFVTATTGRATVAAPYLSGVPATITPNQAAASTLWSMFLTTHVPWDPNRVGADELTHARLAFPTAQRVLDEGSPEFASQAFATCEWYGGRLDPETYANALVRSDGPLAELVGERLRVTNPATGKSVAVYCHSEKAEVVTDLALSRRAFMELDFLATEQLDVFVEVLS